MSAINTNGININYPTPGVNNSSQGFRDNFNSIKTNLDTTKTELNELQNKVILKSALSGTSLNNDMANALISNASVRNFRAPTYNLGSSIPSTLVIDISKADVQYGTIVQDTVISFGGWSPTGTQSNVQLNLTIANISANIVFPSSTFNSQGILTNGMTTSARVLENYGSNGLPGINTTYSNQISAPAGITDLQLKFSSVNCGATIDVYPLNRSQIAGKMELRRPSKFGAQGDTPGTFCTDGANLYVCVNTYNARYTQEEEDYYQVPGLAGQRKILWGYVALNAVS
jgi:hypothetical protein